MAVTNTPDKSEMLPCPWLVVGSIYDNMEASIVRDDRTIAHFLRYSDACEVADILNSRPPADQVPDMVERVARAIAASFEKGSPDIAADLRMDWQTWEPEARAALQAVPAASEVGWQPIESAPKDGMPRDEGLKALG